jgi:hypothetical protein
LWEWLSTLPKLRAFSVVIIQTDDRATDTIKEVLQNSPARVRGVRVALMINTPNKLREYKKTSDSSEFHMTFGLTQNPRDKLPAPMGWYFCRFKTDLVDGYFL